MTIQERIQSEIADAMRKKDELRLSVLRMMKSAIKNREVEKLKALDENECAQVLNTLIKQRRDSIEQFRKGGREELAAKEENEIPVIEEYLPAAVSEADIDAAVEAAIAETGANSAKQMGLVMKNVMARMAGRRADGKVVSDKVRARLG